jgi:exonuclease 3'-5' domain-containing protein 1
LFFFKDEGDNGGRDYSREAVEYFKKRLEQYGNCTEVPIKSLLGHRSQAPPEVRHVSGQHIKEFRDFLAKYPDDFVVNDEVNKRCSNERFFKITETVI